MPWEQHPMKPDIIQRICGKLTGHRFRLRYDVKNNGRQYCRCRLCGWHSWEEMEK